MSERILEELRRHEELKHVDRGKTPEEANRRAQHLIERMRAVYADAIVTGWEPLEGSYGLVDPDDEHVVAAAVVGGAGGIVTDNFKHINAAVVPTHIKVLHPAEFVADTADVDPARAAAAIHAIAARSSNPAREPGEIVQVLVERYGMDDVAEILGAYL